MQLCVLNISFTVSLTVSEKFESVNIKYPQQILTRGLHVGARLSTDIIIAGLESHALAVG